MESQAHAGCWKNRHRPGIREIWAVWILRAQHRCPVLKLNRQFLGVPPRCISVIFIEILYF